jgi:hypothetical protein
MVRDTRDWIATAIDDTSPEQRTTLASIAIAVIDGFAVLDRLGLTTTVDDATRSLSALHATRTTATT